MRYWWPFLFVAGCCLSSQAQEPEPPMPSPAPSVVIHLPQGVSDVPRDAMLIITSETPLMIVQTDQSVLKLTKVKSPWAFFGRFADSGGANEYREYTQPHVWVVTAGNVGATELLLIPVGVQDGAEIVRRPLTVGGPRPPPGPGPDPQADDLLDQCHRADRASQVQILRALAAKNLPRDVGGLTAAKDFVNAERIRRRTEDWIPYTDAVAEAIVSGTVSQLADKLEGKKP